MIMVDPLEEENISLDGNTYPLAADFQAPLALSLAELNPKKSELAKLFKPDKYARTARLARLQPLHRARQNPVEEGLGLGSGDPHGGQVGAVEEEAGLTPGGVFSGDIPIGDEDRAVRGDTRALGAVEIC